jgi:hypothetical protein
LDAFGLEVVIQGIHILNDEADMIEPWWILRQRRIAFHGLRVGLLGLEEEKHGAATTHRSAFDTRFIVIRLGEPQLFVKSQ